MQIWTYALPEVGINDVAMPAGARVLDAQMQDGKQLVVWALVDDYQPPLVVRRFHVVMTGEPLTDRGHVHVATVQPVPGMVLHVFECELP